ncbi:hypothetical protein Tco_1113277 [Tanacetum coccineum]|uniref:Uncharacterized protein n=1 Tax=Tanacetum coccineum TaxID=301880 RepID=A0ABQ5IVH0_9ASTR
MCRVWRYFSIGFALLVDVMLSAFTSGTRMDTNDLCHIFSMGNPMTDFSGANSILVRNSDDANRRELGVLVGCHDPFEEESHHIDVADVTDMLTECNF